MPYECKQVAIEDRVTLCSGLCCVIASLPPAQWEPSLAAFAQPILTCIDVITKQSDISPSVLTRLSNEVRLLGAIVRCFIQSASRSASGSQSVMASFVLASLIRKCWRCLTFIGETYRSSEVNIIVCKCWASFLFHTTHLGLFLLSRRSRLLQIRLEVF